MDFYAGLGPHRPLTLTFFAMNLTALEIEQAFGMSGITLEDGAIIAGSGLDLAIANHRLSLCRAAGKLPPEAEAYQVRAWLIRNGIDLDTIPSIISASVPEGPQRNEALMRWEYSVRVPMNHPLVAVVAASLNVQVQSVWWDIIQL
jgi:hypothetical protein